MTRPLDRLLRPLLTGLHGLMKLRWRIQRPQVRGAHAAALTPGGKLVLVRLRYARGWRFPGGGVGPDEEPAAAVLRELREEIGLVSHGAVRLAHEERQIVDHKQDRSGIFIVEDVVYRPAWSWEVEATTECDPDAPPPDLSLPARRWIAALRPQLPGRCSAGADGPATGAIAPTTEATRR